MPYSLTWKLAMSRRSQQLMALLESRPVVTLKQIQQALDQASRATVFRYLQKVPYRRSYNHNGGYYARDDSDHYDRYGLWIYDDVFFSRDGSLKMTLRRLIQEAEAGFTHRELRTLLRVQVQFALSTAMREGVIDRASIEGLYVYVHPASDVQAGQLKRRRAQISAAKQPEVTITDTLVIEVLLVLIRHLGAEPGDVVHRLRGYSPPITRAQVDTVFDRYQLAEKKTPVSNS